MKKLLFIITILLISNLLLAKKKGHVLLKENFIPNYSLFDINNIYTFIYNNGEADKESLGSSGFFSPKDSNITAIYTSGFIWGAKVNGEIRVGGSTYGSGLLPGAIKNDGTAEDRNDEKNRVYRVTTLLSEQDVELEAQRLKISKAKIREQYKKDWDEWPAEKGAPFNDIDGDNLYNPKIDIPGVQNADQTLWFVANDLDSTTSKSLYGSLPMGVELQCTVWGYNIDGALSNALFKTYKLINKSNTEFTDMYFAYWTDEDIGDASDDFVGYDSTLSLMYAFNGKPEDAAYGLTPPAIGVDLLQGPIIPAVGKTAIVSRKYRENYRNLKVSAHPILGKNGPIYNDPDLGKYKGTLEFYNLMQGKMHESGEPFVDINTGDTTMFALAGDPVTGTGWLYSQMFLPQDVRQVMASGPFNMEIGDTQEVVVAQLGAFGSNNIDAITKLREADKIVKESYIDFLMENNAPKPNNVISYTNEKNGNVTITWEKTASIEDFNEDGLKFQGYNLYQFQSNQSRTSGGKLIAVFDKVDGIKTISQMVFNPKTGEKTLRDVQFGTDSGLKYEFNIAKSYLEENQQSKSGTYYFGVTAYTYSDDISQQIKTSESLVSTSKIVFTDIPNSYTLNQNYPNPFNPTTTIEYSLPINSTTNVVLKIYDMLGREVKTLVNEPQKAGNYKVTVFVGGKGSSKFSSGVYFYRLQSDAFSKSMKMILLK